MINSRNIDDLMPSVAANVRIFVARMAAKGYKVAFSCVLRDQERQTELHNTIGAPALVSFHWGGGKGKGLAFDIYQDASTYKLQWKDAEFWKTARAILTELGFSPVPGEESHSQWDAYGKYTSAMVRAGNLPPPMPIYQTNKNIIQSHCNFSDPTGVWKYLDKHPYADKLYEKWARSYGVTP